MSAKTFNCADGGLSRDRPWLKPAEKRMGRRWWRRQPAPPYNHLVDDPDWANYGLLAGFFDDETMPELDNNGDPVWLRYVDTTP